MNCSFSALEISIFNKMSRGNISFNIVSKEAVAKYNFFFFRIKPYIATVRKTLQSIEINLTCSVIRSHKVIFLTRRSTWYFKVLVFIFGVLRSFIYEFYRTYFRCTRVSYSTYNLILNETIVVIVVIEENLAIYLAEHKWKGRKRFRFWEK